MFNQRTIEALAYYVYALVDPRDNRIFYIGKGKGNRAFQHMKDSLNEKDQSLKLDIIRSIIKEGKQVNLYILRHNLTEETAFIVEPIEGDPNSRYVASINNTYELKNLIGPGSASASVTVMIRLRQETGGNVVYKTLMEPRTVTADAILPVRFKAIEGVYGVDTGQVEVVDVENDRVLMSYDVQFFKVQ